MSVNVTTKTDFKTMEPALLAEIQETIARNRKHCSAVIRLAANPHGRDFIVGDIHGAFNLVRQAMRAVNFDQSKDRLFSCGDLIDRGAESQAATRFLAARFVHSIMGNHEHDLLHLYSALELEGDGKDELPIQALSKGNWNGTGWLAEVEASERADVIRAISKLPLAIEVETPRGVVGIIHGEVPVGMDWNTFRQGLIAGDPEITESCLFGRKRAESRIEELIQGIDRVFCGHTPQFEGASRLGNVFFVDTGAVFSQLARTRERYPQASLTMARLTFNTGVLSVPSGCNSNDIRVLDGEPGDTPFNSSWLSSAGGSLGVPSMP